MPETNIKPSVVIKVSEAFYTIFDRMMDMGLTERDLIILIQNRVKGSINRSDIKKIIEAIKSIEKQFISKQEK